MNLAKLFRTQKVLSERIGYYEPDRFNKLILALLVELGECANEQRSWKFWSKNQNPRTKALRNPAVMMEEDAVYYNPLLEEYVDKLHFILDLGLEIEFDHEMWLLSSRKLEDITIQYIKLAQTITDFWDGMRESDYVDVLELFFGLGQMLGFTWEQVEEAYFEKNAINHERQERGY